MKFGIGRGANQWLDLFFIADSWLTGKLVSVKTFSKLGAHFITQELREGSWDDTLPCTMQLTSREKRHHC